MNVLPCTALTTACLTLLLFVLSVRVVWLRLRLGQPLGDGGDARLARALRVQGNFIEYVPLSLLVMLLLEWHGAPAVGLQAYGAALVLARTVHALAVSRLQERLVWRILSTALTLALLSGGAAALLLAAWPRAV